MLQNFSFPKKIIVFFLSCVILTLLFPAFSAPEDYSKSKEKIVAFASELNGSYQLNAAFAVSYSITASEVTITGFECLIENQYEITAEQKEIIIPDKINGLPVTKIGDYAFNDGSVRVLITKVTVPKSVKTIGEYAFSNCTNLTEVILGENVESIGTYAFHNCTKLNSLVVSPSLKTIGENAFYSCMHLISKDIYTVLNSRYELFKLVVKSKVIIDYIDAKNNLYNALATLASEKILDKNFQIITIDGAKLKYAREKMESACAALKNAEQALRAYPDLVFLL